MSGRPVRMLAVGVGLLLVAATACGTTVPEAERGASALGVQDLGNPLESPAAGAAKPQVSGPSAIESTGPLASPGPLGSGTRANGGGTGPTRADASPPASASVVEVGIAYISQESLKTFSKAAGAEFDPGDPRAQAQALVNYVNAHGGLAGHRVVPIFYELDVTNGKTYAQYQQDACALWTQDHHVTAGVWWSNQVPIDALATCLRDHHAVFYHSGVYPSQVSDYTRNAFNVAPDQLAADRMAPVWMSLLNRQGFLSGHPTIGIVTYDDAASQRAAQVVKAELKKLGHAVKDSYTVSSPGSIAGISDTISQIQAAAVRFHAEGIDHVVSLLSGGFVAYFMAFAQSQSYAPFYGLSSLDATYTVLMSSGVAPPEQLTKTVGMGWLPYQDVDGAHDPGGNPTVARCQQMLAASGTATNRYEQGGAYPYCDFLLMLQAAAAKVSVQKVLTGKVLLTGINALERTYRSPLTFGTNLQPARHDGVTSVRPLRYDTGCRCFQYSGPAMSPS